MQILEKTRLAPGIVKFVISAPHVARKAQPGQFVIVRHRPESERIPLTIADFDRASGSITLVCQGVGKTTREINRLEVGQEFLGILGPLGEPFPVQAADTVICVAGGLGVAPLYPKAKAYAAAGTKVVTLMGAQSQDMLIMRDEMAAISTDLRLATDDGSVGHHGFVTELLESYLQENSADQIIAIGPVPMMAAAVEVAKRFRLPAVVSLNVLMVDGTGMCGGCRVRIDGEVKFCCVDGPAFDGYAVDFAEVLNRQRYYREMEQEALHRCRLEEVR